MIDWEKEDDYFSVGCYEKYREHDDHFSVNVQENSIFDIFKAVEENEYVSDLKSEGFLIVRRGLSYLLNGRHLCFKPPL